MVSSLFSVPAGIITILVRHINAHIYHCYVVSFVLYINSLTANLPTHTHTHVFVFVFKHSHTHTHTPIHSSFVCVFVCVAIEGNKKHNVYFHFHSCTKIFIIKRSTVVGVRRDGNSVLSVGYTHITDARMYF